MTVAIFMGHSGSEKGAQGIVLEDDITRQARTWAVNYARAHGVSVYTENDNMVLKQRIKNANARALDGILEFHGNYLGNGKASGAEVWYSKSRSSVPAFAKAVTAVFDDYGYKNRGAKPSSVDRYGRLGILDDTNAPGLLVELFFVDSAADVARWRKNGKAYVEAITKAWIDSIGVKTTATKATVPANSTAKPASKPAAAKSISQLADEVLAGKYGSGDARKKALGSKFAAVQAEVNRKLGAKKTTAAKPKKTTPKRVAQKGKWTARTTVLVRSAPSKSAESVAKYYKGESVKYDSYIDAEGIRWCSYVGASGKRRYVARRTLDNKHIYADAY